MCSDSRITDNNQSYTSPQPKIAVSGQYLLGAAGDLRALNILHHIFVPPVVGPRLRGKKLDTFITAKFIPALRECFDKTGYATSEHASDVRHVAEQDSSIWVVVNSVIYVIGSDYSWYQDTTGLYSLGSGQEFATGALQALIGKKIPTFQQCKAITLKAMAIAAKNNFFTAPPFHVFIQHGAGDKSAR